MRLHRFYVDTPIEYTKIVIKDERLIYQWRDVFRYNVGSEVIIFDGSENEYDAVIEKLTNREAELRLVSEREGIVPEQKFFLYQSLIKKDKMEWVVEKALEDCGNAIIFDVGASLELKAESLEVLRASSSKPEPLSFFIGKSYFKSRNRCYCCSSNFKTSWFKRIVVT